MMHGMAEQNKAEKQINKIQMNNMFIVFGFGCHFN